MSRELCICPGVGGRKCGAFQSSLDRDPHPTCARCRGKICTHDMTCGFCVSWSPAQWELFAKKRTHKERKRSRPSGSVPPAPEAMLRAGTSSEVPQLGSSSSSFSRTSGDRIRGGGLRVHLVLCPGRLPPLPLDLNRARGGCLDIRPLRASVSSAPSGAGKGAVARSQRTPPARAASSVASPRSSQHARRRDKSREVSEDRSLARSSCVSQSSDLRTRKDRRARSRSDSSRDRARRSRSRSSYRSRSRASKAVILPRAVAIFGSLPLSERALSFSGRPVSILGSIPLST